MESLETLVNGFHQEALGKKFSTEDWIVVSPNLSSSLTVSLAQNLSHWRLEDKIPEPEKYVFGNYDSNTFFEAPFAAVIAFADDPNTFFDSPNSSQNFPSISSSSPETLNFLTTQIWCNNPKWFSDQSWDVG